MEATHPSVVVIGGPNGAGKSTAAPYLLRDTLGIRTFVNADVIARGLSGFDPERSAIAAGRILLEHLDELAARRADFAFETTLASRRFEPWLRRLIAHAGYSMHLLFLWLPSAEMAVARVRERVRSGGHDVPEDTVRRRYSRGISNFLELYRPLATSWRVYDNSSPAHPELIARREAGRKEQILDETRWRRIRELGREADAPPEHR